MSKVRVPAEEIVLLLDRVERLIAQGATIGEAAATVGVKYGTLYQWRRRYTGLDAPGIDRLRRLELENARLRRSLMELEETHALAGANLKTV